MGDPWRLQAARPRRSTKPQGASSPRRPASTPRAPVAVRRLRRPRARPAAERRDGRVPRGLRDVGDFVAGTDAADAALVPCPTSPTARSSSPSTTRGSSRRARPRPRRLEASGHRHRVRRTEFTLAELRASTRRSGASRSTPPTSAAASSPRRAGSSRPGAALVPAPPVAAGRALPCRARLGAQRQSLHRQRTDERRSMKAVVDAVTGRRRSCESRRSRGRSDDNEVL